MTGLDLARELALLGAADGSRPLARATGADGEPGASLAGRRVEELGRRMAAHLDIPDAAQESLCGALGLSPLGYWLVMLCGAAEVFPDAAAALSTLAGEPGVRLPTATTFAHLMGAAQGVAPTRALSEALTRAGAERLGLIERAVGSGARPASQEPLRLALGVLAALLGGGVAVAPSPRIDAHREEPASTCGLDAGLVDVAAALLAERGVLCVRAATARSGRQLALDVASRRGESAFVLTASDTLPDAAELGRLRGALPVLDLHAYLATRPLPAPYLRAVGELLPELVAVVPASAWTEALPTVEVAALGWADSRRIWTLALDDADAGAVLAGRYRVSLEEARAAVRAAHDLTRGQAPDGAAWLTAVAQAVRAQGVRRLEGEVAALDVAAPLPPLLLPPAGQAEVARIVRWQRALPTMASFWALPEAAAPRAMVCLVSGPAGAGKTLVARHVAAAAGLNLFRLGLDLVQPGQERRLAAVVAAAEAGHGLLLLEDLDAAMGDDAARWAVLRQHLAVFAGVVLITARTAPAALAAGVDVVVRLAVPDAAHRERLWEAALPLARRRGADVDTSALAATLPLTGGGIQAAVRAAAAAADAQGAEVVGMAELLPAARHALARAAPMVIAP